LFRIANSLGKTRRCISEPAGSRVAQGGAVRRSPRADFLTSHGFTLLEVLVAMTLLFVAVAALSGLSLMATQANVSAKTTTFAALLASQKIEQLRALTWGYDALGQPQSDAGLALSPADALEQNTIGYCDFLDANGTAVGSGSSPPAGAMFVRRWSIQPLPSNPANALVFQVVVKRMKSGNAGSVVVFGDEAALATVRTRTGT
jgi:type II secretory pathway pseudopilin PulG